MANKKRDRNGYRKQLGRYKLSRADILAIEKLLWEYADAREMNIAGADVMPEGRKHMPRKYADRHIEIGRYQPFFIKFGWGEMEIQYPGVAFIDSADSVKFLPDYFTKRRYVVVACKPGITVSFTPLTTTIYAQTHYATGKELKIMKRTVAAIESYLTGCKQSFINVCYLKK